jgi:hypothetical protein
MTCFLALAAAPTQQSHVALLMFLAFVTATLIITYYSGGKSAGSSAYFAAGRRITGWQNGLAVAGDYMSAASFLGISGMIAFLVTTAFMSVGWLVAYLTVRSRRQPSETPANIPWRTCLPTVCTATCSCHGFPEHHHCFDILHDRPNGRRRSSG